MSQPPPPDERSPSPRSRRTLAFALGLAIAAAGWFAARAVLERRDADVPTVELRDASQPVADMTARRAELLARGPEIVVDAPWRMWVEEDVAKRLFPLSPKTQVYDPFSYYRAPAHLDLPQTWREHPEGSWSMRTNALGLREDVEVATARPDVRVLVTGDSHTDGVCRNAESYANRLEAMLAAGRPGQAIEVLNAGKGGFGFHNYLGVLERFRELPIDVFVVGVYAGNDFQEVLGPFGYFAGATRPRGDRAYWAQIDAVKKLAPQALPQGLMSIKYFAAHPDQVDVAVGAALGLCGDIAGRCRARGIRPIVALIPSPYALDPARTRQVFAKALDALALDQRALVESERVSDRFLDGLRALELEAVDLRSVFRAQAKPPYWSRDHHIDLLGHELIAGELAARLDPESR